MCAETASSARPRDRILETAQQLFHKHGIRGVGVDAIADAAGTNKMTLYRHFGSKDDLVAECLRAAAGSAAVLWDEIAAAHPDDKLQQVHAWVRVVAQCVVADDRGCALANAAVELTEPNHPARRVIEEFKQEQRRRLARLCAEAGIPRAELLADSLSLLLEGARVSCQAVGPNGPSAKFVEMAEAIIASFAV
jgi:AcrR family transcriptional regulator